MFYPTFYRDCWINISSEVWMFMLFLLSYPSVPKLYLKPKWTNKSIIIIIMQDAFDNDMSNKRNDRGGGTDDAVSQTQPWDANTHRCRATKRLSMRPDRRNIDIVKQPLRPLMSRTTMTTWDKEAIPGSECLRDMRTAIWPATGAEHLCGVHDVTLYTQLRWMYQIATASSFRLFKKKKKKSTVRFFCLSLACETDWIVNRSSSHVFTSAAPAWETVFTSELFSKSY